MKIYKAASLGKIPFPDKAFQKWDYKIHTGRKLNLRHPVTFQEKLQWMKYYYRNPEFTKLVDKYEVRDYVKEKIGEEYLVPLYGVYNSWNEIDFSALPDAFVIKCTHDSGSVVICKNKSAFDYDAAKKKIEEGLARNQFYLSREWPYKNVKPRIIIEKYLIDEKSGDLPDYKFFCFDGKVKILESNTERQSKTGTKTDFYTPEFELIKMKEKGYPNSNKNHSKPENFDAMKQFAETLSANYP
ncbi:MAG: glycosyl transferase, partial [Lachnospiraceae bacterium]|nr:glycosyl transferase [Lachnospiraceae bacterium]